MLSVEVERYGCIGWWWPGHSHTIVRNIEMERWRETDTSPLSAWLLDISQPVSDLIIAGLPAEFHWLAPPGPPSQLRTEVWAGAGAGNVGIFFKISIRMQNWAQVGDWVRFVEVNATLSTGCRRWTWYKVTDLNLDLEQNTERRQPAIKSNTDRG